MAIAFALGAAFVWGMTAIFVRRAGTHMDTSIGTLISLLAGLSFLGVVVGITDLDALGEMSLWALAVFGVIGLLNLPFGRYLNYLSINHIGASRATSLTAAAPLFALIIAVVFTGESIAAGELLGTALILCGVYLTTRAPS